MIERLKREILESKIPSSMPLRLIAIDGHGGAGKTTLAKLLSKELNAEVLHTDDFASYDKPMDWWRRLVDEVFRPIQNGTKLLNYSRGAWYKDHQPDPVDDQQVTSIMILEGVSSSRKEFREYLAYSIWVETPKELCLARGIARDLADNEACKTKNEIVNDWEKWHAYEDAYVAEHSPLEYVDTVIDGTIQLQ